MQSRVAWLSLDESENDTAQFCAYLVGAVQQVEEGLGQAASNVLGALGSAQAEVYVPTGSPPLAKAVMTALINQINAFADRLILVLDDYHLITSRSIHYALTFLLDRMPANLHLVIATRADPPLPLARLRGRGQLTELRQADLQFSVDQVDDWLNQVLGLELAARDVAALTSRTEGWAAGLQMAVLSMQTAAEELHGPSTEGTGSAAAFIQSFTGSHRHITDYFLEEVFDRQPADTQTFLLHTAILDRLTGPLCDAVLGIGDWRAEDGEWRFDVAPTSIDSAVPGTQDPMSYIESPSQQVLEHLDAANLFTIPLDDERQWYRYHRLMADLLRQRLQQVQPALVPILHRRASSWHEQNQLMAPAIDHALLAQDLERAADLIDNQADAMWEEGAQTGLSRWLEALPEVEVRTRPRLIICKAMLLTMAGRYQAAEETLQVAERGIATSAERMDREQQGKVAAIRALLAYFQGNLPAIVHHAREALELLPRENRTWRSSAALNLGDAHRWNGDMLAATRAYEEAADAAQAMGSAFLVMLTSTKRIMVQVLRGLLRKARDLCQQQLQLIGKSGWSETPMAAGVLLSWGDILREWNHLDEAGDILWRACRLSEEGSSVGVLGLSYLTLLRFLWSKGDRAGYRAMTQKLENLVRESAVPVWIDSGMVAWKVHLLLEQAGGDVDGIKAADQLLQERGLNTEDGIPYPREVEYLALARVRIAQGAGQPEATCLTEALALLERMLQAAESGGRAAWVLGILILRALAFQAQGKPDQAMDSMGRALSMAEPEGYVRTFVDEGEPMKILLEQAKSRGTAREYVGKLLEVLRAEAESDRKAQPSQSLPVRGPLSSLVDPLSERELEVLRLLATPLSTREIAEQLVLSIHTVRSHTRSIYSKLDVHSRYQAIACAEELDLL